MQNIDWVMTLATVNWGAIALGFYLGATPVCPAVEGKYSAEALAEFGRAQKAYRAHGQEEAVKFGRACFDLAEFATNNTERAAIAQQGIAACRSVVAAHPNSAP